MSSGWANLPRRPARASCLQPDRLRDPLLSREARVTRPVDLSPAVAAEIARLRTALDAVPALSSADDLEEAVHAARRSIKVLRAWLRLIGPVEADPLRRDLDVLLRDRAASLSPARDLTIAADTVRALRKTLGRGGPGGGKGRRKALRARLAVLASEWSDRAAAVERVRRGQLADAPALEVLEARLLGRGLATDSDRLASEVARTYGKARRALRSALQSDDAEEVHAARKIVVRHQLQHALVQGLGAGGKGRQKDLARLRNLLGDHHDLSVTEALAGGTPHDPRLGLDLSRLVEQRQGDILERCRPLADALFWQRRKDWQARLADRLAKQLAGPGRGRNA
jgi:hypothetical protein